MEETRAELKVIIKNITSSIEKWEKIRENVKKHKILNYYRKYWLMCGYCVIFGCRRCPLRHNKSRKYNMPYCYGEFGELSVASGALKYAHRKNWRGALNYTNILLAKMKRDLDRFENKLYKINSYSYIDSNKIKKDNSYYALD